MNSHAREVRHRAQHGFCLLLALILLGLYALVALAYLVGDGLKTIVQRCGGVGRNKALAVRRERGRTVSGGAASPAGNAAGLFRPTRLARMLDRWSIRGL